jgi:hypothetical protein
MVSRSSIRRSRGAVVATTIGTALLAGCALVQPPPVPRLGQHGGAGDPGCVAALGRAQGALAAAGAAAGDPSGTAAAHAAHAGAMHEYHMCLARRGRP